MRSYVAKGASYASRKWAGHGWACGLPQAFPLWLGRRLVQPWGCIICFLLLLWQITTRVATTQTVTLQCRRSEVWYRSHWVKIKGAELPPFFAGSRGESVSFRPPASRGLLPSLAHSSLTPFWKPATVDPVLLTSCLFDLLLVWTLCSHPVKVPWF